MRELLGLVVEIGLGQTTGMPTGRRGSVLASLLFADTVGSTKVAEEMADRRWRELQERHHRIVRP